MTEAAVRTARPLVLVVDDDVTMRLLMRESLEQAGFAVEEAENGVQALATFSRVEPDIVLLDVRMPAMDGFTTCAALRRLPSGEHTPVLMVTGLDDYASINRAYEVGATDFITKPITWPILSHRVRYMLRASRAINELRASEEAVRQEAQISTALVRVGREITSSLDASAILNRLCQLAAEELQCDCSHTFLWQPAEEKYVPVASWGDTPDQHETLRALTLPREAVPDLLTALRREAVVQQSATAMPKLVPPALLQHLGIASCLYMALQQGEDLIGIQTAGYRGQTDLFTTQQQRIALGIAQIASMALQNARLLEQAESANRLKSEFLATMSHELRTPLNIILGYNELLLDVEMSHPNPEQVAILQRVGKSARELFELITAMLDVSRLEAGRMPVAVKTVQVAALMKEVETETREVREQTPLEFSWHSEPQLPLLSTDPIKLKVVLKNLIGNAIKFTPTGGVTVHARPREAGVEICVADTGVGIAPEDLPTIFEPFRQGVQTQTQLHSGVGLGLYIVRRMLELLGGTVTVESTVGCGSTFHVWVPQHRGQ
jgi:two-component system cell cycle sensor histidine kinase PleC